jgi:hypothetical protein
MQKKSKKIYVKWHLPLGMGWGAGKLLLFGGSVI